MDKIQASAEIHQPIERVFEFAWHPKTQRLWLLEVVESIPLPEEAGRESVKVHKKARGWAGLTLEVVEEILDYVPNRRIVSRINEVHGWLNSCSEWDFEPVTGGTRVTVQHVIDLHGWLRLVGPIFISAAQRKVSGDLLRLKEQLEKSR